MVEEVSVRGLVDSDFELPVREFTGTFTGYDKTPATGYQGWRLDLKFKDIDDVVCSPGSVYNFPTIVLNVGQSNKHKSRFGYLADSIAKLLPSEESYLSQSVGRKMTLKFCDGQDGRPEPKPIWNREADPAEFPDKMMPTAVWVVTEIAGFSAGGEEDKSTADWAAENLIGKTRAQFNKWAFADARIRSDTPFQRSIQDKSFINTLIQLKRVVEDGDGTFQALET